LRDPAEVGKRIDGLANRFDEEHIRRTGAEKNINTRLDALGEAVVSLTKSVQQSLQKGQTEEDSAEGGTFWSGPWPWALGVAALAFLVWLLFRKEKTEPGLLDDEVFVLQEETSPSPREESRRLAAEALGESAVVAAPEPPKPPPPAPPPAEAPPMEPAPRVQSLRISSEDTITGGDVAVRGLLQCDPRVLVEPEPRVELRSDGSLSIRFYVRGQVDPREAEELARACRALAAKDEDASPMEAGSRAR
jgi:hypothetical protein